MSQTEAAEERPPIRAWCILALTVIATLFGFVDRQVLVVLADPVRHDLGLSDGQLGLIQGLGPGILSAFGVLAVGWLADRTARQLLLAGAILAWSIATAACGLAHSFWDLLGASVAIGIGEAALGPVIYSIYPDIFPGRSRVLANLIYFGASMVGAGLGIALAGATVGLVQAHGSELPLGLGALAPWRAAFILAALPGLPLAIAVAAVGPIRRALAPEGADASHTSLLAYLKRNWQAQAGLAGCICAYGAGLYAVMLWTPVYVMRALKASPAAAGAGFGLAITSASVFAVVFAGVAVRRLTPRFGAMAPLRLLGAAMGVAILPTLGLLFARSPLQVYVLSGLTIGAAMTGVALLSTIIQDMSPPAVRGRMLSITTLLYLAAGGMGPIIVGLVSDRLPPGSHGLLWAIVAIAGAGFVLAVASLWLADKGFRRTIAEFAAPAA